MWIALLTSALAQAPLSVTTFNVWGLPWPIAPRRARRMAAIDAWLHDSPHDLVAIQEAWRGARSHLPGDLHYPDVDGDSGLALYSRHGITRVGFVPFEAQRGPDAWKTKGVWWVRLERPSTPWTVGVVHLQAGTGARNADVRRQQVQTVLDSAPPGPLLLLGDFNLHRGRADDLTHALLLDAGLVEARPRRDRGTSRYGSHRLDRIYATAGTAWSVGQAKVLREVETSDHFPVQVDLVPRKPLRIPDDR